MGRVCGARGDPGRGGDTSSPAPGESDSSETAQGDVK